jgi:hypothetical protein
LHTLNDIRQHKTKHIPSCERTSQNQLRINMVKNELSKRQYDEDVVHWQIKLTVVRIGISRDLFLTVAQPLLEPIWNPIYFEWKIGVV